MNPEQDNFQDLRRLLALKRHEQPPPGYFDNFSGNVIARIQASAVGDSWFERLLIEAPWLEKIWNALVAKPALAGTFGLGICSLLVAGVIFSEDTKVPEVAITIPQQMTQPSEAAAQPAAPLLATPVNFSSTEAVLPQPTGPSIFQEIKQSQESQQRPLFQQVGLQGNN